MGQVAMPRTLSSSSNRSMGSRAGRSSLFMKVKIGTPRRLQTSNKLARLGLDAFARVDDHDGGVHGGEHAVGVLGEILVARGVEEVDAVARVIELQHSRGYADAALFFEFHPVARRRALFAAGRDAPGELHRAAVKQEFLGERGLARVRVADDGERTPTGDFLVDGRSHGRACNVARYPTFFQTTSSLLRRSSRVSTLPSAPK